MIVLLDQGNSRVKWRLIGPDTVLEGSAERGDLSSLLEQAKDITELWLANVAGPSAEQLLLSQLSGRELAPVKVNKVSVQDGLGGLRLAYPESSSLGVDRWLQMLAAHREYRVDLAVISAGTTMTVDFVNADGRHQGGLIAPGLASLFKSLSSDTAMLPALEPVFRSDWPLGQDTRACIESGVSAMWRGFLDQILAKARAESRLVVVCGGDAIRIASFTSGGLVVRPNLALDGLQILCNLESA